MRRRTLAALALLLVGSASGVALLAPPRPAETTRGSDSDTAEAAPPTERARTRVTEADRAPPPQDELQTAPRTVTVRGVVRLSPEDTPAAGATVTLHSAPQRSTTRHLASEEPPVATATSGTDGRYEITGEVAGAAVIATQADRRASRAVSLPSATADVDQRLAEGTSHELLVTDEHDAPVAGATLHLAAAPSFFPYAARLLRVGTTDGGGRCRLRIDGTQPVVVTARGYASTCARIAEGDASDGPQRIVLQPERHVAGVVEDEAGRPLPGASVDLGWRRSIGNGTAVRSAADGTFEFTGLAGGADSPLTLRASMPGRLSASVDVLEHVEFVRIVLPRPARLRGVVVHEDGSPVHATTSGVEVDDAGRFELRNVAPGSVRVSATAVSPVDAALCVAGEAVVEAPPGEDVEGVRIVLRPPVLTSYLELRVVGPSGSPAWYAEPSVYENGEKLEAVVAATRRDDTLVVSVPRPPGTRVQVVAHDDLPAPLDAVGDALVTTAAAPPLPQQELTLRPPGSLRLELRAPDGSRVEVDAAVVDHPELFSVDGVRTVRADEVVHVVVQAPGCARREATFRPPHAERRVEALQLERAATIAGRIVDADGQPVAWPRDVIAMPQGQGDAWSSPLYVEVGPDGRFEASGLPAGPVRIWSESPTGAFVLLAEARAGETDDVGDVRVRAWTVLRGRVLDDTGRPLGGATIESDAGLHETPSATCRTDADGTFALGLLADSRARLIVRRAGYGARALVAPPGAIDVVLQPGGALRVRTAEAAARSAHCSVSIAASDGTWWWSAPKLALSYIDAFSDRPIVIPDLPVGPQRVRIESRSGARTRDVTIVAGETVDFCDDR